MAHGINDERGTARRIAASLAHAIDGPGGNGQSGQVISDQGHRLSEGLARKGCI